jgi:CheY-like chemotaxis protein
VLAPPVILLIENEEDDVFLFRRALSKLSFKGSMRLVGSVSEACEYLKGEGKFADRDYYPLPDLIVSDMNLPGATGNAFLEWLRRDERFCELPLVFLSGSFLPLDKVRADALGAEDFFGKTGDIEVMCERVRSMLKYLPRKASSGEDSHAAA